MTRRQYIRDLWVGLTAMAVAVFFLAATPSQVSPRSDAYGISGQTLPMLVAGILIVMGVVVFFKNLFYMRHVAAQEETPPCKAERRHRFRRVVIYTGAIAVYIVGFSCVDYILSSTLMVAFGMWFSGFRNRAAFACIACFVPVLIWYVFTVVMEIPIPESIFGI